MRRMAFDLDIAATWTLLTAALLIGLPASTAWGQAYDLELVASSDRLMMAPGGVPVVLTNVGPPDLNDAGQVAYEGDTTAGKAMLLDQEVRAIQGGPFGANSIASLVGRPKLNSAGAGLFFASLDPPTAPSFRVLAGWSGVAWNLAPPIDGHFLSGVTSYSQNDAGQMALVGSIVGCVNCGIYVPGSRVVTKGQTIAGFTAVSLSGVLRAADGTIYFGAIDFGRQGILTPSGIVVDTSVSFFGDDLEVLRFKPELNDTNGLAFRSSFRTGGGPLNNGLFDLGGRMVKHGDVIDTGSASYTLNFVDQPSVNAARHLAFLGQWNPVSPDRTGIFLQTDVATHAGELVAQIGDQPFPGADADKTIVSLRSPSLNGAGQIAFVAGWSVPGGSGVGVVLATPSGGIIECADGFDNDGDGFTDFPADPGCSAATDTDEQAVGVLECDDGLDNDGDGAADFRQDGSGDDGCRDSNGEEAPDCSDGDDNDLDGDIDSADADCAAPWQESELGFSPAGEFQGLGDLPSGLFFSKAHGISGDGLVVVGGGSSTFGEAFKWTRAAGMVGLGDIPTGNNGSRVWNASFDGSVLVGEADTDVAASEPMRVVGGVMQGLGEFPGGDDYGIAFGVSDDGGVIVGMSEDAAGPRAFTWSAGTGLVSLGSQANYAYAVSGDGNVIVGEGDFGSGPQAYRRTGGGFEPLPALPGGGPESRAFDVSDDGAIVVGQADDGAALVPVRWAGGASAEALSPQSAPGKATAISSDGQIAVGAIDLGAGPEAFVWEASLGLRLVKDLLVNVAGQDVTGWVLKEALGVAADGRSIAGWGIDPDGLTQAWLVTLPRLDCADEQDNDGDLAVDFPDDAGCTSAYDLSEAPDCSDGLDNDRDGTIDTADPGCDDALDGSERSAALVCDDGLDNDSDGLIDFPDDTGCSDGADADELTGTVCNNGLDDDGDGLFDFPADPGCKNADSEIEDPACDDDEDNDGDGRYDWDGGSAGTAPDPQCAARPFKNRETVGCGIGFEAALLLPLLWRLRRRS